MHRLGFPAECSPHRPEPYASALPDDGRSAAEGAQSGRRRYERAIELAESGEVEPTLEALTMRDGLGAGTDVEIVRSRLRAPSLSRGSHSNHNRAC